MDETYTCPECGGELEYVGQEKYGADRDGNRWIMCPVYYCGNCGYVSEPVPY